MDTGAELTLQIVRRVQAHARPDLAEFPHLWRISLEPSEDAGVARVRVHPTMGSPPLTL